MPSTATREYVGYEPALPHAGLSAVILSMVGAWIMGAPGLSLLLSGGLAGGVALSGST